MTRTKSVLNMMMMSFSAMGVVGLIYVLYGLLDVVRQPRTSPASSRTPSSTSA